MFGYLFLKMKTGVFKSLIRSAMFVSGVKRVRWEDKGFGGFTAGDVSVEGRSMGRNRGFWVGIGYDGIRVGGFVYLGFCES